MKSAVVAYEDEYHGELHGLVKALRRDRGLGALVLEPRTARGTGNFAHEAPRLLRAPLAQTRHPPDRVVCLADADRPANLVPGAPAAPTTGDADALTSWVIQLETEWRAHLVRAAGLTEEEAARLHVICLRWSKESVLIACPDALLAYAAGVNKRRQLEAVLALCDPDPATLTLDGFLTCYRRPSDCLDQVFSAIEARRYKKGLHDDDVLPDQIRPHAERRRQVLGRCPDLMRLLALLDLPA